MFGDGLTTLTDLFKKEDVEDAFYKVVFPKHKYQGSLDAFQRASRLKPESRVMSEDEQRILRLERSIGVASSYEKKGANEYGIGLNYFSEKYLKDINQVTREEALKGYQEYLTDKETYADYLDKSALQMYEMSGMYGSDFSMDQYVEYQSMEKKMADRNGWQKLGDALTMNYASLSPESKSFYNEFFGKIRKPLSEGFEGDRWNPFDVAKDKGLTFGDFGNYMKEVAMNNAFSNLATSMWMGAKVAGPWGAWAGGAIGLAGVAQEISTGDTNISKEIQRGFYGGVGQTGAIIGQGLMELDYRMGFEGLVDKMRNIDTEEGISDENIAKAYEAEQEYLYDISPLGMLGDIMYNMGNSIQMSGKGRTKTLYEGNFQKGWANWIVSYVPEVIGQAYGMMALGGMISKATGLGATAGGATNATSKMGKIGTFLKGKIADSPALFMYSASEAWGTRENLMQKGGYTEDEIDERATETLWKNAGLMSITGAMPGAYSKMFGTSSKFAKYGMLALDTFSEGFEEVMQDKIQKDSMDEEFKLMAKQTGETFLLGMVGGFFGGMSQVYNDVTNEGYINRIEKQFGNIGVGVDTINAYKNKEISSEEAVMKLHDEMVSYDKGDISKRLYNNSAVNIVTDRLIGGVKGIYNQSKSAIDKAKERKAFIKNDLNLDGLDSKIENGAFIVELFEERSDAVNQHDAQYRITNQVVKELTETEYKDISAYDKQRNRVVFSKNPKSFTKTIMEEVGRRQTVMRQIEDGQLKNVKGNRETTQKLYEAGAISGGKFADTVRDVFGESRTGVPAVDNKVRDAKKVSDVNQLLKETKANPTKKNLEKLKRAIQQMQDTNNFGYGTFDKMNEQLVNKEYLDSKELNEIKNLDKDYDTLEKQIEEQERQDAIEKIASLSELTKQIEDANKGYQEKLKQNKELKEAVKKDKKKLKGKLEGKVTLEELDIYDMVYTKDGEVASIELEVEVPKVKPKELKIEPEVVTEELVVDMEVKPTPKQLEEQEQNQLEVEEPVRKLELIDSGSNRDVYDNGDSVIKIASEIYFRDGNKVEADVYSKAIELGYEDVLAKIISYDEENYTYVEMEKVETVSREDVVRIANADEFFIEEFPNLDNVDIPGAYIDYRFYNAVEELGLDYEEVQQFQNLGETKDGRLVILDYANYNVELEEEIEVSNMSKEDYENKVNAIQNGEFETKEEVLSKNMKKIKVKVNNYNKPNIERLSKIGVNVEWISEKKNDNIAYLTYDYSDFNQADNVNVATKNGKFEIKEIQKDENIVKPMDPYEEMKYIEEKFNTRALSSYVDEVNNSEFGDLRSAYKGIEKTLSELDGVEYKKTKMVGVYIVTDTDRNLQRVFSFAPYEVTSDETYNKVKRVHALYGMETDNLFDTNKTYNFLDGHNLNNYEAVITSETDNEVVFHARDKFRTVPNEDIRFSMNKETFETKRVDGGPTLDIWFSMKYVTNGKAFEGNSETGYMRMRKMLTDVSNKYSDMLFRDKKHLAGELEFDYFKELEKDFVIHSVTDDGYYRLVDKETDMMYNLSVITSKEPSQERKSQVGFVKFDLEKTAPHLEFDEGKYEVGDLYTTNKYEVQFVNETRKFVNFKFTDGQVHVGNLKYSKSKEQFIGVNSHFGKPRRVANKQVVKVENSVSTKNIPTLAEIGANPKESEHANIRKKKVIPKKEFDNAVRAITEDVIFDSKLEDGAEPRIDSMKKIIHMFNDKVFSLRDGKKFKTVNRRTEVVVNNFKKEFANELLDKRIYANADLDFENGQHYGVEPYMDFDEIATILLKDKNFTGFSIWLPTKNRYDYLVKNESSTGVPSFMKTINIYKNSRDEIQKSMNDIEKNVIDTFISKTKTTEPEQAKKIFNASYEQVLFTRKDLLNAFKKMFMPEYESLVEDMLTDNTDVIKNKEAEKLREEICK